MRHGRRQGGGKAKKLFFHDTSSLAVQSPICKAGRAVRPLEVLATVSAKQQQEARVPTSPIKGHKKKGGGRGRAGGKVGGRVFSCKQWPSTVTRGRTSPFLCCPPFSLSLPWRTKRSTGVSPVGLQEGGAAERGAIEAGAGWVLVRVGSAEGEPFGEEGPDVKVRGVVGDEGGGVVRESVQDGVSSRVREGGERALRGREVVWGGG